MADKVLPEKLTTEELAGVLRDLDPGTLLVIDLPEGRGPDVYAAGIQKTEGGMKDAAGI